LHETAIDELTSRQRTETRLLAEYEACRLSCEQYQNQSLQHIERCRTLEDAQGQMINETNQFRSQLAVTSQLAKDQATHIIDLERRLMQANELIKTASQRQVSLEQQLRDIQLTSQKNSSTFDDQMKHQEEQLTERDNRIHTLEVSNNLLRDEIKSLQGNYEHLTSVSFVKEQAMETLQTELNQCRTENESVRINHQIHELTKQE
jgi:hypothetical protein